MSTITGFANEAARQANIKSGRISSSAAALLPLNTVSDPKAPSPIMDASRFTNPPTPIAPPPAYRSSTDNLGIANNTAYAGIKSDASYTPPVNPAKEEAQGYLKRILGNLSGQAEDTNKIYEEAGLAEKKKKAEAISTEMDTLDKQFRDRVLEIKKNPEGKFGGAINQDISKENDTYQNTRANIALTYKVASEDYNGASEIVNQKVTALKDQNAQSLQAYQLLINSINNDLTESEKLQVQDNMNTKKAEAEYRQSAYADVLKRLADNPNTPASVYSAVDKIASDPNSSISQIYGAGGTYLATPPANKYTMGTDAYGNPVSFNTSTGEGKVINTDTGTYDLSTYATDPAHADKIRVVMQSIGQISNANEAQNAISTIPNSPITGNMIMTAAQANGVDPTLLTALLKVESQFGTQGAGAKTFNPGNVGNTDDGSTRNFKNWNAGVDAAAQQLAKRDVNGAKPGALSNVPVRLRPDVTKITGQFDNEQVVKDYNQVAQGYDFAKRVEKGDASTDDQGLIYAFAKAMDPNSVVREGEYATVQKYAQSWANQFGFNINKLATGGNFLSPSAKKNLVATIGKKYDTQYKSYKNLYSEYGRKIDAITGKNDGTAFLQDYSQAFSGQGGGNSGGSYEDYLKAIGQ